MARSEGDGFRRLVRNLRRQAEQTRVRGWAWQVDGCWSFAEIIDGYQPAEARRATLVVEPTDAPAPGEDDG